MNLLPILLIKQGYCFSDISARYHSSRSIMSTDFSLDALLNGSTSNTSVTSPHSSNQPSAATSSGRNPTQLSTSSPVPQPETKSSVDPKNGSRKRNKRCREDANDEQLQQKEEKEETISEPKKKRVRIAYTRQQLQRLESIFAQNQYPDMLMRENIAEELGLPDQKIHVRARNVSYNNILLLIVSSTV